MQTGNKNTCSKRSSQSLDMLTVISQFLFFRHDRSATMSRHPAPCKPHVSKLRNCSPAQWIGSVMICGWVAWRFHPRCWNCVAAGCLVWGAHKLANPEQEGAPDKLAQVSAGFLIRSGIGMRSSSKSSISPLTWVM